MQNVEVGKCNWYEHGEKSLKYFVNLEKSRAVQNQIRNILKDNIEINNQKDINKKLYLYYKTHRKRTIGGLKKYA